MYKITAKSFSFFVLALLLIISLGFTNKAEASSKDESIVNNEDVNFTNEVPSPFKNKLNAEDSYFFSGTLNSTLYTSKTVNVKKNLWFYVDLYSSNNKGTVTVTVQKKGLTKYSNIASYKFTPNFSNKGGKYDRTELSNLKSGKYRLKITRSPSTYTTVDGGMGGL